MTLPVSPPGDHPHFLHTRFKVAYLPSRNNQACLLPSFLHTQRNFPWSTFNEPSSPVQPQVSSGSSASPDVLMGPVLSPSSTSVQPRAHTETSHVDSKVWEMAESLRTQPQPVGLPPSEAIPTGLGTDLCCLVASMRKVKTKTQRVTCSSRCSASK